MTTRTKAGWLFAAAAVLIAIPYVIVFAIGSVWMWRPGLIWCWAVGTGVPTLVGLTLAGMGAATHVSRGRSALPHPSPAARPAGQAAMQAVREISRRLQTQDPPLDQPDVLEKLLRRRLLEVLGNRGPALSSAGRSARVAGARGPYRGVVELVARDFRRTFTDNVPWGNTRHARAIAVVEGEGRTRLADGAYLWQINRVRRLCMRPATALVQELQDQLGPEHGHAIAGRLEARGRSTIASPRPAITPSNSIAASSFSTTNIARASPPAIEALPFDQEPLQVLVVGQVKSGKSSLINALLGQAASAGRYAARHR